MTKDTKASNTEATRAKVRSVGAEGWLKRCWMYLSGAPNGEISEWQAALLSRRKLTHPAEVTKLREPVRPTTRATWYR